MAEATLGSPGGTSPLSRAESARLLALLLPIALLGGAYAFQYIGGLYPCEMCWWQRYAHAAAILLAAFAFSAPAATQRSRMLTLLAALAIAVSGLIGFYHAGVELKIFEGFTTCTSTAKAASTAELLKQLMKVPLIRCDQVQWSLFGISMAGWNAIFSLSGAAVIAWLSLTARRAR
jgi:disulfide bond formation protein DsbB